MNGRRSKFDKWSKNMWIYHTTFRGLHVLSECNDFDMLVFASCDEGQEDVVVDGRFLQWTGQSYAELLQST